MEGVLKQSVKDFSKQNELIQTILIALLAFLVPTFLAKLLTVVFGESSIIASNSQLVVGSIVNTALIITALNLKGWSKNLLVVTMPSISTVLSGYVFKSASVFMVYMIPAIWIGNLLLVLAFKYIMLAKKQNYWLAAIIGIIAKVAVIFGIFSILNSFGIFPEKVMTVLQKAMGYTQAITATIGSIIAFTIYLAEKKK